jgi:hypothetical protein
VPAISCGSRGAEALGRGSAATAIDGAVAGLDHVKVTEYAAVVAERTAV